MTYRATSSSRSWVSSRLCVTLAVVCAMVLASCSSGGSIAAGSKPGITMSGCKQVTGGKVTVVTKSFDFDPKCLTSAGPTLTVRYDNAEKGVRHNFHLEGGTSNVGTNRTELKPGPDVQTITYVGLKPGTYTYTCDLHAAMKGTLEVTAR